MSGVERCALPIWSSSPGFEGETEFSVKIPAESESGNYIVTATASSNEISDSESIQITVLILLLIFVKGGTFKKKWKYQICLLEL